MIMDALKKVYDKWQCIEENDNDVGMLMFSKGDLLSFAKYYHQSKVNDVVLDAVINTLPLSVDCDIYSYDECDCGKYCMG